MSLNLETKHAASGTLQFIGRFLEKNGLGYAVPTIYKGASCEDQLDYWLANLELAGHGHSILDFHDLLQELRKDHLQSFKTEIDAALEASGAWGFEGYRIEPANAEATQFHLSKEHIYQLSLQPGYSPSIARRQVQATDRKCLVFELISTRPDDCICWSAFKCASQRFAQLARRTYSPGLSNRTNRLPYTKTVVYCPEPQEGHQAFYAFVALRYFKLALADIVPKSITSCQMLTDLGMLQSGERASQTAD